MSIINNNVIQWIPSSEFIQTYNYIIQSAGSLANPLGLVRVTLKGHLIWQQNGDQLIYLDGQAFGTLGTSSSGTSCVNLNLPSGANMKASDFESWFWLSPQSGPYPYSSGEGIGSSLI